MVLGVVVEKFDPLQFTVVAVLASQRRILHNKGEVHSNQGQNWAPNHEKVMVMDRTCDEKRARQHLPHGPSLYTGGKTEKGLTQEL